MRIKSVNDVVFDKEEAHHLSFFDIQMSVRPDDVERASSVVDGRVPSRTTAQMQSPEVDSATQLDECSSSEGTDVVMGLVSSLLSGLVPLCPYLILIGESFDSVKYTLEIVYSDISYLRIFRVETLFSILLENLVILSRFRALCSLAAMVDA
ncbi:hypothetical protein Tco_1061493 [Tanacetum coccineum]